MEFKQTSTGSKLDAREKTLDFARANREEFLIGLSQFLTLRSVSTDPSAAGEVQRTADWLSSQLEELHFQNIKVNPTKGNPIVTGEWLQAGEAAPTVLIYGHYDVQPADPIDSWHSDPFQPTIVGDNLFARGASDMKGPLIATFAAVKSALKTGGMPVNVKFLLEGEEEIGSPSLADFISSQKDHLFSNFALNPDAGMIAADIPTIETGLRGLAYFELHVFGPDHDLHSGLMGGVVHNPAQALSELIAGMHDAQGHICLPGFYEKVQPLTQEEKQAYVSIPVDEKYYLQQAGVSQLWGESGYSPVERIGIRPTLDVNGLYSGYIGEGPKTIIPAWAMAKISMRLVPDQDPAEVHAQLKQYLTENCPPTVRWELKQLSGSPATRINIHTPAVTALAQAYQTVWGRSPVFKHEGGSIPVVTYLQKILEIDSVVTGFTLPDAHIHAPDERLHLPTWERGIDSLIHFFYNLTSD